MHGSGKGGQGLRVCAYVLCFCLQALPSLLVANNHDGLEQLAQQARVGCTSHASWLRQHDWVLGSWLFIVLTLGSIVESAT
jgi:hypothetical protein